MLSNQVVSEFEVIIHDQVRGGTGWDSSFFFMSTPHGIAPNWVSMEMPGR